MKKILLGICLLSALLFSGCATFDWTCPYIVSDIHVESGEKEGFHHYAGAYFELYNDSAKEMTGCTLSFLLYDEEGNVPFIGTNTVVADLDMSLPPASSVSCVVNLDPFLAAVSDDGYQVDYFYLRKISYRDGSVWTDPLGMYAVSGVSQ